MPILSSPLSSSTTSTNAGFLFLEVSADWLSLFLLVKILVKKSTDLELNLPFSRFSFLRRSFLWGISQLISVASPLFFISFVTFFFIIIRRRSGSFFNIFRRRTFNAFNALSAFWYFFGCNFFLCHNESKGLYN